jgi:hypothetical protein
MQVHYIENFVRDIGCTYLDYYNYDTLHLLNTYIYKNFDISSWKRFDIARVELSIYSERNWPCSEGLYFWDGNKLIFPFFNGQLNCIGSSEYDIDQTIDRFGFIPNVFQLFRDYLPHDVNYTYCINSNRFIFSNLYEHNPDLFSNIAHYQISNNHEDTGVLTVLTFSFNSSNYFVITLGALTQEQVNYMCTNGVYDLEFDTACYEYNLEYSAQDIKSQIGYSDYNNDHILFLHPRFMYMNFDIPITYNISYTQESNSSIVRGTRPQSRSCEKATKPKFNKVKNKKCGGDTNKGQGCSRMAKEGYDYCGIHLRAMQEARPLESDRQCICVTAKGIRCNRIVKTGYDYCGIHLKKI